jgi:hypothetical protein
MEKRRNKFDGEQTYPMMGRAFEGPCKLEGGGRRLRGLGGGGGRKINNGVKVYSGSRLIEPNLIPRACLMDNFL